MDEGADAVDGGAAEQLCMAAATNNGSAIDGSADDAALSPHAFCGAASVLSVAGMNDIDQLGLAVTVVVVEREIHLVLDQLTGILTQLG